jgi:hypothetical protein
VIILATGFLAGCAFAAGCALVASHIRSVRPTRRRRPDLVERLLPYRAQIAEEVEFWLREQSR